VIGFRGGSENRAESDVIRLDRVGLTDLIRIVCRESDDPLLPQERACIGDGEVSLSEMDAVRRHGHGQVATVVDDQQGAGLCCGLPQGEGLSIGLFHRGLLVSILKEADTQ